MTTVISILFLGILIFVHELGHFLVAKFNNVGVIEFAIGFGHKIWQRQYGETMYSLRIIPLGGYVRMVGEEPGVMEELSVEAPEAEVVPVDRSRWFMEKGYLAKCSVVLAGPGANILFAIVAAWMSFYIFGIPEPIDKPLIGAALPGSPAEVAGLKSKDLVKSIDGVELKTWMELAKTVQGSGGKEMSFLVERKDAAGTPESKEVKVTGTKDKTEVDYVEGREAPTNYRIGIQPGSETHKATIGESFTQAYSTVWYFTVVTVRGLSGIVIGHVSPKNLGGPLAILKEATHRADEGIEQLLGLMVFVSVSLAVLNLLPIPVLDGGHLIFFTIEKIKGSPLNVRWQQIATQIGMLFLFMLMLFALGNDLTRMFSVTVP